MGGLADLIGRQENDQGGMVKARVVMVMAVGGWVSFIKFYVNGL